MKLRFALLSLSIAATCFLGACGDDPEIPQGAPSASDTSAAEAPVTGPDITASPNPVPAAGGKEGTTKIAWNTGAGLGEVFLSMDGTSEKLFARSEKGSQAAPWIAPGKTYEFRLYAANDHSKVLAKVIVTQSP